MVFTSVAFAGGPLGEFWNEAAADNNESTHNKYIISSRNLRCSETERLADEESFKYKVIKIYELCRRLAKS